MCQLFIDLADVQTEYDRRLREAENERRLRRTRESDTPLTAEFLALLVAFAAAFGIGH